MSFEDAVEVVFEHEGGYVDHPEDPGGATNFGITLATLERWRGNAVTKADVADLSRDEAAEIYRALYWAACRCDEMPPGIALVVFDSAVDLGVRRSIRLLQRALRVGVDGALGPVTLGALNRFDPRDLIDEYMARRAVYYGSLNATFHLGWYRRLMNVHRRALSLSQPQ